MLCVSHLAEPDLNFCVICNPFMPFNIYSNKIQHATMSLNMVWKFLSLIKVSFWKALICLTHFHLYLCPWVLVNWHINCKTSCQKLSDKMWNTAGRVSNCYSCNGLADVKRLKALQTSTSLMRESPQSSLPVWKKSELFKVVFHPNTVVLFKRLCRVAL